MKSTNPLSKPLKKLLNATLSLSANSTSCCVVYEPKAPKKLDSFKKLNNGKNS